MAKCAACSRTIIMGGVRDGDARYCNRKCHENGYLLRVAQHVPESVVQEHLAQIHGGLCPRCSSSGPVDVHESHRVWSALVVTSWRNTPHVCCRSCGRKAQLGDAAFSLFLGWWGFPWGLVMTPVQIIRNLAGLFKTPDPYRPSPKLAEMVRIRLAAHALSQQQAASPDTA